MRSCLRRGLGASPPIKARKLHRRNRLRSKRRRRTGRRRPTRSRLPSSCSSWWRRSRCIPDSLVAQILAASTFPEQVVEADRWVQAHPDLKGDDLGKAVDQQPWDPSVKALTAFPSVLGNMDKNLSWTSSLGDAYYNQQQDVTDAVQVMRQRAQACGQSENHAAAGGDRRKARTIVIEPARSRRGLRPGIRSVDGLWRSYFTMARLVRYPGIWYGGPYLSFGFGFPIGFFGGFGWGWGAGDSTGTTTTRFTTTAGTSRKARRFTTVTTSTAEERHAEDLPGAATLGALPRATARPFKETIGPHEDTPNLAAKVEPDRAPSAATIAAAKRGAFRRAEAPVSAAGSRRRWIPRRRWWRWRPTEVIKVRPMAHTRSCDREKKWREGICGEQAEFRRVSWPESFLSWPACFLLMGSCRADDGAATGTEDISVRSGREQRADDGCARATTKRRCSKYSGRTPNKSSRRATRPKTPKTAPILSEDIEQMHRLMKEPDGTTTLYVGPENWPMPIPLVDKGAVWYFDTAPARRKFFTGESDGTKSPQSTFARGLSLRKRNTPPRTTANTPQKIFSDKGQQDGLYWKAADGPARSPIGPLVASAFADGSAPGSGGASPTPYRGYYYQMLPLQGSRCPRRREKLHRRRQNDRRISLSWPIRRNTGRPA